MPRSEFDMVYDGLTQVLRLLRRPTDRPDLDVAEMRTRVIAAKEYLRLSQSLLEGNNGEVER